MKPSKPAKPSRAARLSRHPPAHTSQTPPATWWTTWIIPVWQGPIFAQGLFRPKQTRVCRHQGPARQGAPEARESIGSNRCNSHQWRCNGHTGRLNGHGIRCNPPPWTCRNPCTARIPTNFGLRSKTAQEIPKISMVVGRSPVAWEGVGPLPPVLKRQMLSAKTLRAKRRT